MIDHVYGEKLQLGYSFYLFTFFVQFSPLCVAFVCTTCRRKSRSKRRPMGFIHNQASPSHTGIRTVGVEKVCNFSTDSDLCISIVTWNMNGQVYPSNFTVSAHQVVENLYKKICVKSFHLIMICDEFCVMFM